MREKQREGWVLVISLLKPPGGAKRNPGVESCLWTALVGYKSEVSGSGADSLQNQVSCHLDTKVSGSYISEGNGYLL